MEKRVKNIFVVIVLLAVLAFVLYSFRTKYMQDLYKSDKWIEKRLNGKNASDAPLTKNIVFNDQLLIYDEVDDTFYYSLVTSDADYYNPVVATANDSGIHIAFGGELLNAETIAAGETIDLVTYRVGEYHVSKLACTTLPVLDISIDSDLIEQEGFDETFLIDDYIPVSMYMYDNSEDYEEYGSSEDEVLSRSIISDAQIHTRGQTSRAWEQKGYKLELLKDSSKPDGKNNKINLLGIREDDDWILTSAYSDYDKLRNAFASNLWSESFAYDNQWQVENGVQYRFVELFFNGRYHGLYTISDPFDAKQVALDDDFEESLFKKKDWSMSEFNTELEINEATGKQWRPGYFLEAGEYDGYEKLQDLYVQMMNSSSVEDIRAVQDIDNVVDLWLYFKFTQATDNIYGNNMKNVMVSVKRNLHDPEEYALLMAPWDMDYTFNYWMDPSEDAPIYLTPITYLMFYRDQDICDEIKEKYAYLRDNQWSDEAINESLDTYEQAVFKSGAYVRNKNRWPEGNYQDGEDGVYNLDQFRKYVFDRLSWMDSLVSNLDNTYILE